jgi:hypothetical protein
LLFGYKIRELYIYEHVFTPLIAGVILHKLLPWYVVTIAILLVHVVVKELIVDRIKHGNFNWQNVAERLYGMALLALFYFKEMFFK